MAEIEGLIVTKSQEATEIVGFAGGPFICEGCEESVNRVLFTDDDVQLCQKCLDACDREEEDETYDREEEDGE